ncbi:succinate--CoA ligase subunit alpha [Pelagibius sp.]|uniref:succinate--CoA ligase subunit alpha n=1 Tax=Pelagibius sp. TaxID=1931238 RepID=UPI0026228528|nr:succinate--CoA ligase subunit alpha [Pelagibius sp.]
MAILIDGDTKVICQGFTGKQASYHMERAIAYGTQVVGGVVPGKGGRRHLGLPVFDSVVEAVTETGATASAVFVPPDSAADALIEAIDAELPLVVCVTERIPVLDMVRVKQRLAGSETRLIGPNSQGILNPGRCKIGVMPAHLERPGGVGVVSRSASLTSEVIEQISEQRLGQSTSIGIGGDPVHGMGFVDCLELFFADPDTDCVVLLGEIGGDDEEQAADYLRKTKPSKPVIGYVAGLYAPTQRRMGHAGTVNVFGQGGAADKMEALRGAGVTIAASAAEIGQTVRQTLRS